MMGPIGLHVVSISHLSSHFRAVEQLTHSIMQTTQMEIPKITILKTDELNNLWN